MAMETMNTCEDILDKVTVHSHDADYLLGLDIQGGKPYGVKLFDLVSCETEDWGSLDEALLWMDRQMDRRRHPHAGMECRSFDPEDTDRRRAEGKVRHQAWLEGRPDPYLPKRPEPADIPTFPKGCAVFRIRILYRQHGSWQGEVVQMRRKTPKKAHFRSALELLYLLHSALPDGVPSPEQKIGQEHKERP